MFSFIIIGFPSIQTPKTNSKLKIFRRPFGSKNYNVLSASQRFVVYVKAIVAAWLRSFRPPNIKFASTILLFFPGISGLVNNL